MSSITELSQITVAASGNWIYTTSVVIGADVPTLRVASNRTLKRVLSYSMYSATVGYSVITPVLGSLVTQLRLTPGNLMSSKACKVMSAIYPHSV